MQELRSCGNTRQAHNNVDEIRDDLSDISGSPNVESMEEWSKANPFVDKKVGHVCHSTSLNRYMENQTTATM